MATSPRSDLGPLDSLAERFAALWRAEGREPPDLLAFLSGHPEASARERTAVILVDQRERWRAGVGCPVEDYLTTVSDLANDPNLAGELVMGELSARRERGEVEGVNARTIAARLDANAVAESTQDALARADLTETQRLSVTETDVESASGKTETDATRDAEGATIDSDDDDTSALAFQLNASLAQESSLSDSNLALRYTTRFTIDHRLGTGGMGVVYQAYDHQRGERLALKTMRRINPLALYRFKQEFRALADISHPNLVNLYELIAVGEVWFFTMELVPGADFIRHVRSVADSNDATIVREPGAPPLPDCLPPAGPLGPPQLARLRAALRQLAVGVSALHDAGKLHRDIKPTNVLVTPEGRVVLLDFGLTADLERSGLHHEAGERIVGTVGYMSPEQSAGQPLATASDWYSVGVILFESLTGLLPFRGKTMEVIEAKQRTEPPAPSDLVAGLPADLNTLCFELLRRDPAARPSGADVLARLSVAREPAPTATPGRIAAMPLIGRERHREALDGAYAEVKAGKSLLLFVSGRPGSGKSTLLQAFLDELAAEDGAIVLAGRCYERESVPFKALDSVVDTLSRYLMSLPADKVRGLLPDDVALLARMFPVLQRVEAVASAPRSDLEASDQQQMRRRAVAALRELLGAMSRTNPLVVAIDDLQWGDPENAVLIENLVRPPGAPVMLLIGSYRTDDAEDSPLVRLLHGPGFEGPERRELAVGALTNAESRELALALLGRNDAVSRAEAHVVARESQGNPFFIDELVKHIQSGEDLTGRGAPTGQIALDDVLWRRVFRLSAGERLLLELVAISGRPISLFVACQAAGLGVEGRAAAAALRAARLLRGTGRPLCDEVETYHDWVRETVVTHLPREVIEGHHLRLARVLEAGGQVDPETLAVHYEGAGQPDLAAENYARAADRSAANLAFSHAARLYRLALELRAIRPDAETVWLRTCLGDVLANAGRGREAAQEYLAASSTAPAAVALELKRRAAMQLLISGHVDDGFSLLSTVLDARRMSVPRSPTGALLALVRRRVWLRFRGLGFTHRDATQVTAEALSLIDLCWSAGAGLSIIDPVRGADFQTRGLLLALKAGEPYRVARALILEASTISLGGVNALARTTALQAEAETVARALDHPHLDGLLALSRGVSALMCGRWKEACRWFNRAEPILRNRCTGVAWELDTTHNLLLWALTHLGDLPELRRRWPVFIKEARERGDLYAVTTMNTYYMALLKLADDEPAQALAQTTEVMVRWSQRGYHVQHSAALRSRAAILHYRDRPESAWEQVQAEWPLYRASLLPRIQWLRVQMTELHARSALAMAETTMVPASLLREAERDARALDREGVEWASAHACLIRAGIAARRGVRNAAVALLHNAIDRYEAVDMRLNATAARRCAGQVLGGEPGRALVKQADDALTAQGVRNPGAFAAVFVPWSTDDADRTSTSDGQV